MTREDFEQLQQVAGKLPKFKSVGVFSPIPEGERIIFPNATALPRWRWNLDKPGKRRFDLLVAANVFMYSPDPPRWFRNVFASCKYFLMLDLVRRKRDDLQEFGSDRDCMRYTIGDAVPRVDRSFNLNTLSDRLIGYRLFYGGANERDNDTLHFLAVFRGDLAGPVLRIDDYPTGIRPILPDLSPLHTILEKVESRGLYYHLGIVPALLTDDMFSFLNQLHNMIPVVHGFDHAYPKYAPLLVEKGDPYNQRTVGVFDEFKGVPYAEILSRLKKGKEILENGLGRKVDTYIPPCNIGNPNTGRALLEAGFSRYFSEKRIRRCPLPGIRSDLYGLSSQYDPKKTPDVLTLHTTWEWDLVRKGETQSLDRLLDHLVERKQAETAREEQLRDMITEPFPTHET